MLFLDAINTYSNRHLSEDCIERVMVWTYRSSVECCWAFKITLHYLPDTASPLISSPSKEEDVHSVPKAASVMGEELSLLLEIHLVSPSPRYFELFCPLYYKSTSRTANRMYHLQVTSAHHAIKSSNSGG
jgi:hypothetical protein